jgi:hypothetical protein
MCSSTCDPESPKVSGVAITNDTLAVALSDGQTISVPSGWYPRLVHATAAGRSQWRVTGQGQGIHWPVIDEAISVTNLLNGHPSGESPRSFQRWLKRRPK